MAGRSPQIYSQTLVDFCRGLRKAGLRVSPDEAAAAAAAIGEIDPLDRDQFYHALRVTLLDDPADQDVFDALFEQFWEDRREAPTEPGATPESRIESTPGSTEEDLSGAEVADSTQAAPTAQQGQRGPDDDTPKREPEAGGRTDDPQGSSQHDDERVAFELGRNEQAERLEAPEEEFEAERIGLLVGEIGRHLGTIRGYASVRRLDGDIDLRRALSAVRERTPAEFPRMDREESLTRMVLLVDVSRSMLRNVDRGFLLRFLFECVRQYTDVRVFFFDTSVTEVTEHFRTANLREAIREMERARTEWGAGTTIGECLDAVLTADPFVVDRETVTVIISDGWDAGDLDLLERRMVDLRRRSDLVIWLNPPASSDAYEPEVRGMQTALQHVDYFAGFASVDDLETVAEELRSRR